MLISISSQTQSSEHMPISGRETVHNASSTPKAMLDATRSTSIVLSENRDILREICSRLGDDTLFRLWKYDEYQAPIGSFLADNLFWYERSSHLSGWDLEMRPDTAWNRVYPALLDALLEIARERVYLHGLEDLNSLLVLEEVYSPAQIYNSKNWQFEVWSSIRDASVLQLWPMQLVAACSPFWWSCYTSREHLTC